MAIASGVLLILTVATGVGGLVAVLYTSTWLSYVSTR